MPSCDLPVAFSAVPGLSLNSPATNNMMRQSEAEGKQTASRDSPRFTDVWTFSLGQMNRSVSTCYKESLAGRKSKV